MEATLTETEMRTQALDLLAQIGGKLHGEDDVVYEGTQFRIPAHLSLREAADLLDERATDEESMTSYERVFKYRPHDGARATKLAIKHFAGFSLGKTLHSFFGRQLPSMITIATGPGETEEVPWGAMQIPGLERTTVYLGSTKDKTLGQVFHVTVEAPRKWKYHIKGFFDLIEQYLGTHSIYRGKAVDGGENFIDVSTISFEDVVYTQSVQERLEGDIWAFIQYDSVLAEYGQHGKYAALLSGTYGTGKSLAALLTAKVALENGWSFFMCRPGEDKLSDVLEMARMYQPAVVFAEDVDTTAGPGSGATIEKYLDLMDGIKTKGLKLVTVFTTNHVADIHVGMLRAGRISAVIEIGAMDRTGFEKLGRRVLGDALGEVDWDTCFTACEGYMPAFVREVFNRSLRYSITLNKGVPQPVTTREIVRAADGMRDHHALMASARADKPAPSVDLAVQTAVREAVQGLHVIDSDGDYAYELAAANGTH